MASSRGRYYNKPVTRSAQRQMRSQQLNYPIPVDESDSGNDCTLKSLSPQGSCRSAQNQPKPGTVILTGLPTEDSLPIKWTVPPDTSDITNYCIRYSEVDRHTGKTGKWKRHTTDDAENSCFLENLKPNTPYRICIDRETEDGALHPGDMSDIFHTAESSKPSAPTAIKLVGATEHDSMKITWEIAENAHLVCRYTISLQLVGSNEWKTSEFNSPNKPVEVTGLKPKSQYMIKIVAHTKHCSSPPGETTRPLSTAAPLPPPARPRLISTGASKPTHETLTIAWDTPERSVGISDSPIYYTIQYKDVTEDTWLEQQAKGNQATLWGLGPETAYVCRIIWHSCSTHSPAGPTAGPFTTTVCQEKEQIFKQNILKKSERVRSDKGMPLYQLPLQKVKTKKDSIKKRVFGTHNFAQPPEEKVILIVGATGAGKSTFLNGMVNFVLGTDWADEFRFRLVEEGGFFDAQHKSQTRFVTVYTLHHQEEFKIPYTLTIIDTPGFGDTAGIERDKEITEAINDLFKSRELAVDHIDAIGFVVQSSLARLTATQKYIFESILSLFGKDIASNIFLLITFCDPQLPPVLASIKEAGVPFNSSFKFNNSALFAKNDSQAEENEFNQIYWDMGLKAFKHFLDALVHIEERSLQLTKAVLEERKMLETYVTGLHEDIRTGINKLEQLQKEVHVVRNQEVNIQKNKKFNYTVKVPKMDHKELERGTYVTNCLTCNRTCHYPCKIKDDKRKARCAAMDEMGYCKVCQNHCIWNLHKNQPYRIVWQEVIETRTLADLKERYNVAKGKKMNAQKLLDNLVEDFYECQIKVLCLADEVRKGIIRLNDIALRRNPLSVSEYIDIMVQTEVTEGKPGWQGRVEQLQEMKHQAETIQEVAKDGYFNPFAEYEPLLAEAKPTQDGRAKKIANKIKEVKKNVSKVYDNTKKHLGLKK